MPEEALQSVVSINPNFNNLGHSFAEFLDLELLAQAAIPF